MKRSARTIVILMLAAAVSALAHQPDAAAQSPSIKPGDELRPLYATPEDIADGKQFADSACAGCHGANGISTTTGIPNLAGQRPVYLYVELKTYQSGGRTNAAMNTSVRFVSDDALVKVAAYYASLDPAQPAPGAACDLSRSGPGRQDRRGRMRRMSWRSGRQQDPRHPEPGRSGPAISDNGHEGLPERPTQERHDEVDARRHWRRGHQSHRTVLCAAEAKPRANSRSGRPAGGQGRYCRLCRMPRRSGRQRQSRHTEPRRPGCPVSRRPRFGPTRMEPAPTRP